MIAAEIEKPFISEGLFYLFQIRGSKSSLRNLHLKGFGAQSLYSKSFIMLQVKV